MKITQLASEVGVSRTSLYSWEKLGCPIRDGKEAVLAWMAENRPDELNIHEQIARAKLVKLQAEGERIELENGVACGRLVDRDAVERWLCSFVATTRGIIEGWPEQIIGEMPGDVRVVVNDIAREQSRLLLVRLSEMPQELWGDEAVVGKATAIDTSNA